MDQVCMSCGCVEFNEDDDGYYYCGNCNTQAEGIINTCTDDADLFKEMGMYSQRRARRTPAKPEYPAEHPYSQQFELPKTADYDNDVKWGDGIGPSGPTDFGSSPMNGSYEDYHRAIRWKYVLGFQIMLQMQSKALIQHFDVAPNIIDLHNPIWFRLLAHTRVMSDQWADEALHESEVNNPGEVTESQRSARHKAEPQNIFGDRAVMTWYRYLSNCLPISYTLALSFLFCHVADEPILPTDILKGVLEGKIPYFSAFVDIEKQVGPRTILCPISCSVMFRPTQVISLQKLEATAASIAEKIGLELRPLNFTTLATRYIEELSLPVSKILSLASRIYKWSVPQGIYLSANELKLPSRVFLMSILVVATRVIYNINGFGKWESTMSNSSSSLPRGKFNRKENNTSGSDIGSDAQEEDFVLDSGSKDDEVHNSDVVELLHTLDEKFNKLSELHDNFAHYKDLPSYLQFCKDGVFAGDEPPDYEEENIIKDLWGFYQNPKLKDVEPSTNGILSPGEDEVCTPTGHKSSQGDIVASDRAIRSIKRDMEENKFVYIPPRSKVKRDDHIHYCRKKRNGAYVFAVHGDYYILLRSCAKVCQVDIRTMHLGVLSFERRLREIEKEQVSSDGMKQ